MKMAWIMILALALGCGDDAKKEASNNTTNNATNNTTNNATNNASNNASNNATNNTNSGNNPAQQCDSTVACDGQECFQIGVTAPYCSLGANLNVETCPLEDPDNPCCEDADCTEGDNGRCVSFQVGYCGGAAPPMLNVCRYDECQIGLDCQEGYACASAGTFGKPVNTCIAAICERDADCNDGEGGRCAILHTSDTCPEPVLGCTYDGDECRAAWVIKVVKLC